MRRRLRSNNTNLIKLAMLGIIAMASGFLLTSFLGSKSKTQALSATEFQAGRIIDDSIFYNPNTMTAAEIDAFIDSHSPACDMWGTQKVYGNVTRAEYVKQLRAQGYTKYHDPPFVCVSEYYENPETHKTNFETGGKKEAGMLSAGEIIYRAAHEYNVNPQVLLVMLKKESYVWGDDWPHSFQYNTVMGYACPDGAPCDSKYFGFYNQVMMAAWQLNYYREHIYSYNYRPYTTNQILYNPDRSCGSKSVYLENIATTSLYIYTPYVPNDGALANYPGTSYCGSYGNRNFYMYFREWFGSTLGSNKEDANINDGEYYIVSANDTNKSLQLEINNNEPGTRIIVGQRSDSSYNKFRITRSRSGSYSIVNQGSNLVLDITGAAVQSGTQIEQWTANNSVAQKFSILDNRDGSFSITPSNNKTLSLTSNTDNLVSLSWSDTDQNQAFRLIPTTQPVANGDYYVSSGINQSMGLNINNRIASGSNIELYTNNYSDRQRFSFTYNPDTGYYTISPSANSALSLDVYGASRGKNANIQLWNKNTSCAQQWFITTNSDSSLRIASACSNLFLDVHGGDPINGANIALWSNHMNASEKWYVSRSVISPEAIETGRYSLSTTSGALSMNSSNNKLSIQPIDPEDINQAFRINYDPTRRLYTISDNSGKSYLCDGNTTSAAITQNCYWVINSEGNNSYSLTSLNTNTGLFDTITWNIVVATAKEAHLSGEYNIISAADSSYVLDINGADSAVGANIQTWRRNSSKAQVFNLKYIEDADAYEIRDTFTNRVLDMNGGYSIIGSNISMWRYNGGCNQRWKFTENTDGTYRIQESCGLLSMDAIGGFVYSGTNIAVWRNNDGLNQKWILQKK